MTSSIIFMMISLGAISNLVNNMMFRKLIPIFQLKKIQHQRRYNTIICK